MPTSEDQHDNSPAAPSIAPIRVKCPHCGQPIDVVPVAAAAPAEASASRPQATRSPAVRLGRLAFDVIVQRRIFPLADTLERTRTCPENSAERLGQRPWRMILALAAVILFIGAALVWWGHPTTGAAPSLPVNSASVPASTQETGVSPARSAIIDTLTRYNSAETEAAALLSIEPLLPFIDPGGPFAQRQAAYLAERRRRNAPHRAILLRWAIGEIDVNGTTATAITQETWSNQEAGAVASEQATVRVTYTLRQDSATGRWLIVESSQQPL